MVTTPARCCLALAFLAVAGSAGARTGEGCSLSGGAPWQELRSAHFVIDAAGYRGAPAHLVAVFEELHAAVLASLIAEPAEIPGRVRVILLPRRSDLADYAGARGVLGLFWATPLGEPVILTSADQVDDLPQVVAHELAHHVSFYLFPRQPYWYAEGLAQFVEGVAKVDRQGRRWAGVDPSSGWAAGSVKLPRMRTLVGAGHGEAFTSPYLAAWILYRYLWNERGRQLSAFQQQLMDGVEPARAWEAAFPQWAFQGDKIDLLDDVIAHYQRTGRGNRWEVKPAELDLRFTAGDASAGDLHATLLSLRLLQANPLVHQRLRRQAMEEAEREDPGHPLAGVELARLRGEPALPTLRELAARRPDDGRGWYLLGLETSDPEEREAALRKAVALWPGGALAHAALASHLASAGRAGEALPLADRAVELAPWSPDAVAALAGVALELARCKEALQLQARAVEAVEARRLGTLGADRAALRAGLDAMQRRCAAAGAPP